MRQTVIALLATVVLAVGGHPAQAQISPVIRTPISAFNGLTPDTPFSMTLTATGGAPTWSIVAGALPAGLSMTPRGVISGTPSASGPAHFTVKATAHGMSSTRAFDVSVYYVPEPKPINIPYTLSTIYMPKPSWPSHQWGDLRTNNERNAVKERRGQRMPLLGYYQGDSPEVLDWQIKMAVDRGITNFMFDDYWVDNVDRPVMETSSKAFLAARYNDSMSFAMLYNFCVTPGYLPSELKTCFMDKVLPFYVSQYFSRPNYLKIDGRPVIQLLHVGVATGLYVPGEIRAFLDDADAYIAAHSSYPGAYWIASETIGAPYIPGGTIDFANVAAAGFDAMAPYYVVPYLWPDTGDLWEQFPIEIPPCPPKDEKCNLKGNFSWPAGLPYSMLVTESIDRHTQAFVAAANLPPPLSPLKFITSIDTDVDTRATYWMPRHLYFNGQTDDRYRDLLTAVKAQVDGHLDLVPISSNTGKPLVGLGAWNEHQESSSVEPSYSEFQWADSDNPDPWFVATAAATVFGGPSTYDKPTLPDLGRGFPAKSDWTFSTATGAGLDEWSTTASAGLAIGPDDVLQVSSAGRVILNTPTYVDAGSFKTVKVLVRVDEGGDRLASVQLYTKNSDHSDTAHLFGSPQENSHQFYGPRVALRAGENVAGFRTYTFDLASNPRWKGTIKFLELRFEVRDCWPICPPGLPHMRYSVKRVWMEK